MSVLSCSGAVNRPDSTDWAHASNRIERDNSLNQRHTVQIDVVKVNQLIQDQKLKRWWVAEFSGVHPTTLRRWLSGRIARIRRENVHALASVLTVDDEQLIVK